MKKTNTQKGITLIALIITIVVLLILAVVAIGAVQNDGIIEYAKNARNEYQGSKINEQTILDNYLAKLDENTTKEEEKTETLKEIAITGPDSVDIKSTITLVVNEGTIPSEDVTWTSSKETVATVENGVITTVSCIDEDTTIITATYNGLTATKEIKVNPIDCPECTDGNDMRFYCYEGHDHKSFVEGTGYISCCEDCGYEMYHASLPERICPESHEVTIKEMVGYICDGRCFIMETPDYWPLAECDTCNGLIYIYNN